MTTTALPSAPAWASEWVGILFLARGRTREALDCWGLVREVYATRYGVTLPAWDEYEGVSDRRALAECIDACRPFATPIDRADAREGDLVVFAIAGHPCHVGILLADPWFLHARDGRRSGIERLDAPEWANRIDGFFRWPR